MCAQLPHTCHGKSSLLRLQLCCGNKSILLSKFKWEPGQDALNSYLLWVNRPFHVYCLSTTSKSWLCKQNGNNCASTLCHNIGKLSDTIMTKIMLQMSSSDYMLVILSICATKACKPCFLSSRQLITSQFITIRSLVVSHALVHSRA